MEIIEQIKNVIGMRGLDLRTIDTSQILVNRQDGRGDRIADDIPDPDNEGQYLNAWTLAGLGNVPSAAELNLAANPLLTLSQQANPGETGVIVTCELQGGGNTTIYWRCIDPDGVEHLDNEVSNASQDTWEILTGKSGLYTVAAWASGYGYAEISFEGV